MRTGLEYKALHYLLVKWGDWQERHYLDDSLPTYSAFTAPYSGDVHAGHRILCAEMERSIWQLNWHIKQLPSRHRDLLLIWYAVNLRQSGGFWTEKEKARELRIPLNLLRLRVSRARKSLYRHIFSLCPMLSQDNNSLMCVIPSELSEGAYV